MLKLTVVFVDQVKKRTLRWSSMDQTLDVLTTRIKCGKNAHVNKCGGGSTGVLGVTSSLARRAGCTLW